MGKKSVSKMETVVEPKKRKRNREPLDEVHKGKSKKKGKSHDKAESNRAPIKAPNPLKKRKIRRTRKTIYDLPPEVVGKEILRRIPITSLSAVRSTCKLWNSLSRDWILGQATERRQFLGFMTMDSKVCSLRFDLLKDQDKDKGDRGVVGLSIKKADVLGQVKVSEVHYCKGLLLCVLKDQSSLVLWNPYLGQTRWVKPRVNFHIFDRYALGYDEKSCSHKILKFLDDGNPRNVREYMFGYEIYDFSSDSWRVLDVTPHWDVFPYQRGASLKGNSYYFAQEKIADETIELISEYVNYLICFDFTSERFRPRLALPFKSYIGDTVTLACVKEEQLAVLYQRSDVMHIWVTTKIDPNFVSWSSFLKVRIIPFATFPFIWEATSFFIDEEKKVVVVIKFDNDNTAYIVGNDGYNKSLHLGEAQDGECHLLLCSSAYLPSLVQINQPPKRKARDV